MESVWGGLLQISIDFPTLLASGAMSVWSRLGLAVSIICSPLSDFRFPPGLHQPPDHASGSSCSRENRLLSHTRVRVRVTSARESPAGFRFLAKAFRLGDSPSRKVFPPQPQATRSCPNTSATRHFHHAK